MGNDLQCLQPTPPERLAHLELNHFKVRNVNESGRIVNKGYLEVTKSDLILHVRNAEPVRWPLRCLRRYGYDASLFSFESGRRCATGPGIYAFKSKHANRIFQLVQEYAQHPEESATNTLQAAGPNPVSSATPTSNSVTIRQRSLSHDAAVAPTTSRTVSRSSSHASGINGALANGGSVATGNLSSHPSQGSNISHPPTSPSPLYFNGNGSFSSACSLRVSPVSPTTQYVNSSAFGEIPESPLETSIPELSMPNGSIPEEISGNDVSSDSFGDPDLNYARLKLPKDEEKANADTKEKFVPRSEESLSEHCSGGDEAGAVGAIVELNGLEEQELSRVENEGPIGIEDMGSSIESDIVLGDSGGLSEVLNGDGAAKLCEDSPVSGEGREEQGPDLGEGERDVSEKEEGKDSSEGSESMVEASNGEESMDSKGSEEGVEEKVEPSVQGVDRDAGKPEGGVKKSVLENVSEVERTALLQDVVNGNIRPERLKDQDLETKYNILVNYANLTEQQIQDVLQKLELHRNENISPCTVCSAASSSGSQRVSPLSYYANLDTAGELPPSWQPNGFQFYQDLRTPRSTTSSKGSAGSEFTFEVNRGSCSPVDHNYANLDTLPEVQPLRHSLSSSATTSAGAANWMILQPPPKGKMNYIQLEFDENDQPVLHNVKPLRRSLSSSASSTPPKTPVSPLQDFGMTLPGAKSDIYARIDIEKTVALANSHRQVEGDTDISTRRTRHDVWTNNKR